MKFVKKEFPQLDEINVCDTDEEAIRGADVIAYTTTAKTDDDPRVVETYPYISGDWVKPGAFISMPSAARFDDDYLSSCRFVVDNYKLYEAWANEYPYPTYPKMGIIGCKFTDLVHEGKNKLSDITEITDIIEGKAPGRKSDDEVIVYSVGGMPVEDVAWGCSVYRRALKEGIGVRLNLWDAPEMA